MLHFSLTFPPQILTNAYQIRASMADLALTRWVDLFVHARMDIPVQSVNLISMNARHRPVRPV